MVTGKAHAVTMGGRGHARWCGPLGFFWGGAAAAEAEEQSELFVIYQAFEGDGGRSRHRRRRTSLPFGLLEVGSTGRMGEADSRLFDRAQRRA